MVRSWEEISELPHHRVLLLPLLHASSEGILQIQDCLSDILQLHSLQELFLEQVLRESVFVDVDPLRVLLLLVNQLVLLLLEVVHVLEYVRADSRELLLELLCEGQPCVHVCVLIQVGIADEVFYFLQRNWRPVVFH